MIRRSFTDCNSRVAWLLISQVEHARISGEFARAWREPFSTEVLDAIAHHDDGWAKWEAAPQLDRARGRPLSFTEMAVADAIEIWDDSIAAARRFGPLAGAIVAGHFIGLARGSDHATQPPACEWLRVTVERRAEWLAEWQDADPSHTAKRAERDQQMLLTADLLSLWLCLDGPVGGDDDAAAPNAEMESRASAILGTYRFATEDRSVSDAALDWRGTLAPWPFAREELHLAASALAVPAAKYSSWLEIAGAGRPMRLRWRLRQTLPAR